MARRGCSVAGEPGTCMFVWECLKTEGKHLGMCMDGFMFGSCCVHDEDQNKVSVSDEDVEELDSLIQSLEGDALDISWKILNIEQ